MIIPYCNFLLRPLLYYREGRLSGEVTYTDDPGARGRWPHVVFISDKPYVLIYVNVVSHECEPKYIFVSSNASIHYVNSSLLWQQALTKITPLHFCFQSKARIFITMTFRVTYFLECPSPMHMFLCFTYIATRSCFSDKNQYLTSQFVT